MGIYQATHTHKHVTVKLQHNHLNGYKNFFCNTPSLGTNIWILGTISFPSSCSLVRSLHSMTRQFTWAPYSHVDVTWWGIHNWLSLRCRPSVQVKGLPQAFLNSWMLFICESLWCLNCYFFWKLTLHLSVSLSVKWE